jgi:hypothetical protein
MSLVIAFVVIILIKIAGIDLDKNSEKDTIYVFVACWLLSAITIQSFKDKLKSIINELNRTGNELAALRQELRKKREEGQ